MPRFHLFEFEDQAWLPPVLRDYLTGLLEYQMTRGRIYAPVARKLKELLEETGCRQIVDLGSGGGGPLFQLREILETEESFPVSVVLTDRFPNACAIETTNSRGDNIRYEDHSVDVRSIPPRLKGLRTLFTCFHHFNPETAVKILQDAADEMVPIAAFEFTHRGLSNIVGMSLSPIAVLFQSAGIAPFKWGRILWTYVVPVIPLMYWWDGTVSHLRTYTVGELRQLISQVSSPAYNWEVGEIESGQGSDPITFLFGKPERRTSANNANPR